MKVIPILLALTLPIHAQLQSYINNSQPIPHGTYSITQPLVITAGTYANFQGSTIYQYCPQAIIINTPVKVVVEHLTIIEGSPGQIGIAVQGDNRGSVFNDVEIDNPWIGFQFLSANTFHMHSCVVQEFTNVGASIANPGNPDEGDSEISGCTFASGQHPVAGIFQTSSDGLRVENTKINGGMMYGFALFAGPGALGDLNIVGCSIESQNINVYVVGTTAMFHKVVVVGNEFMAVDYAVLMPDVDQSTITGNTGTSQVYGIVAPYAVQGSNYVGAPFP